MSLFFFQFLTKSAIFFFKKANIKMKCQNLQKKYTAINDAVPIASYLTGGGLVGLGVWLVDEALFDGEIIGLFCM
jgi:hypothetical protein